MQLHEIRPIHKLKQKKRVGRGGKKGTYCGRGVKGQKARAGAKIRPELRDLVKKIPKLRGYKFKYPKKNKSDKGKAKRNSAKNVLKFKPKNTRNKSKRSVLRRQTPKK
ncbi:MAG: hypothetical protein PHI88_02520 [Candidatus Pacebacteria bacterium]|nr:hypothetical protein [Candidatus Paceibacterota bacterium]